VLIANLLIIVFVVEDTSFTFCTWLLWSCY